MKCTSRWFMLTAPPIAADSLPLSARKPCCLAALLLFLVCGLAGALATPPVARADDVVVGFVAIVEWVDDFWCGCVPDTAVAAGDTLVGYYVFNTTTADSSPDPRLGRYIHTTIPYGIFVYDGEYVFTSNRNSSNFEISIYDSTTQSSAQDQYIFGSGINGPDPFQTGWPIQWLGGFLNDNAGTAVSNDSLPPGPPDLSRWPDDPSFDIYGSNYGYRIHGRIISIGAGPPVGIGSTPAPTATLTAWPNPFNPTTALGFVVQSAGPVRLDIYDIRGRRVATLLNKVMQPGSHEARWNGRDDRVVPAASGVYFATLRAGADRITRKLVLVR